MKLLIECSKKKSTLYDKADGIILPLKGFSVESVCYFTYEEIEKIVGVSKCEVFVKMNKNFMNEEIDNLTEMLKKLDILGVKGIFFYDLAILELKKELSLSIDLVWNQTHMVNNYRTCDYYYSKGVQYALLGKEITLEEIKEICLKSPISCMVEVVSRPSVAFSKRSLVTNYYRDLGEKGSSSLVVSEKVSGEKYHLIEDCNGTSFFLDTVTNGTGILNDLYSAHADYIIMREYGLEEIFSELVIDTMNYIHNGCVDKDYVLKYRKLGNYTNFFFKKTIYRVKKNGKN